MSNQIKEQQIQYDKLQLINARTALSQIKAELPSSRPNILQIISKVIYYIKLITQIISIIETYEKTNSKLEIPK